ncbi:MAG: VCBS repeat-containing protein, partial [Planctomycetales bacterium]|nr:VCBS repeat-containing protein [Planctomycetales bacterium]
MPPAPTALNSDREPVTFEELKAQREQLDRTVWSPEVEAQRHEDRIVELWDRLRAADDPWQVFVEFELDALQAYSPQTPRTHELGITEVRFGGEPHTLDRDAIVSHIKAWRDAGYHIVQTEWHHTRFERQQDGPPQSLVSFAIDLQRDDPMERTTVRGNLRVTWRYGAAAGATPQVAAVDTADVAIWSRGGTPAFERTHTFESESRYPRLMPLLLYDLDGNGHSEIILGGNNRILWNDGGGKFRPDRMSSENLEIFDTAVLADFNGDGRVDLMCVDRHRHPLLLAGDENGRFGPSRRCAEFEFELPKVFTAGDVDGDGDLDLYVVNFATFDPNRKCGAGDDAADPDYCGPHVFDGLLDTLWRNNGDGTFSDVTEEAGIEFPGRGWGLACADVTGDGWSDVYVANDEEPAQLWVNQGDGTFEEEAVLRGCAYNGAGRVEAGMGVAISDVDADGKFDLFKTHIGGETNTLYLSGGAADLFTDRTASVRMGAVDRPYTGWGCGFFDYDHDGDLDMAVANGRVSKGVPQPISPLGPFWSRFAERNLLFRGDGKGSFENVSARAGAFANEPLVSRGMAFGDLDGDGDLEVVAAALDRHVYAWHHDGSPVSGFPVLVVDPATVSAVDPVTHHVTFVAGTGVREGGELTATPTLADLTGDGRPEIVVGAQEQYEGAPNIGAAADVVALLGLTGSAGNSRLYAISPEGSDAGASPTSPVHPHAQAYLPGWPVPLAMATTNLLPTIGDGVAMPAAVGDVHPDDGPEIVAATAAGPLYVLGPDGSSRYGATAAGDVPLRWSAGVDLSGIDVFGAARTSDDLVASLVGVGGPSLGDLDGDG